MKIEYGLVITFGKPQRFHEGGAMPLTICLRGSQNYDQPYDDMDQAYEMGLINDVEYGDWLQLLEERAISDFGLLMTECWRYFGRTYDRKFPEPSTALKRSLCKVSHGQPMLTKRQLHPCRPQDFYLRYRRSEFSAYYQDRQMIRRHDAAMDLQAQIDDAVDDKMMLLADQAMFDDDRDLDGEVDSLPDWEMNGFDSEAEFLQFLADTDWFYGPESDLMLQD